MTHRVDALAQIWLRIIAYRKKIFCFSSYVNQNYWILDTGYWILDTGYWILDTGYWILDTGYAEAAHKINRRIEISVQAKVSSAILKK